MTHWLAVISDWAMQGHLLAIAGSVIFGLAVACLVIPVVLREVVPVVVDSVLDTLASNSTR